MKLNVLESTTHNLQTDNERLKLALQRATTHNEILRASSGPGTANLHVAGDSDASDDGEDEAGGWEGDGRDGGRSSSAGLAYSTATATGLGGPGGGLGGRGAGSSTKSSGMSDLLPSAAAWDYIQAHPLFKQGQVDVADVTERLKKVVRCDGHGPGFEKADVRAAIEQSRISSSDELI